MFPANKITDQNTTENSLKTLFIHKQFTDTQIIQT